MTKKRANKKDSLLTIKWPISLAWLSLSKETLIKLLLIFVVVILAYFQTLFMYFWNDDNAIIFKLQHLNEGMGNLGSGIFGFDSPYRMVIFPLIPIYYFFGINAFAFFAYGIIFYLLASVAVYIFAKSIFRKENLALLTSLVFASGLVGAESLWRVYNSIHTSITIIYILLFCTFSINSTYEKKLSRILVFYLLGLFFYIAAIQWGYVRAHGIVLIAVAIELLVNFSWKYSFFRLLPFLYLFYKWYVTGSNNSHHFSNLISQIFYEYNFGILLVPLRTLKNIFIPDFLQVPLSVFLIFLVYLLIKFRSKVLFLSLIIIVSGYVTYFVMYNDQSLNTTHRYLTASLPGFSLLVVYIFSRIFKSTKKLYLITSLYILIILTFLNWSHYKILTERSFPTKNFYQTLKQEIKTLDKNSIIYFDIEEAEKSKNQFKDFFGVGSMPDTTAIAIHFGKDRYDLSLPQTFSDFINLINTQDISSSNIYSFYYSSNKGLLNTTPNLRKNLFETNQEFEITDLGNINISSSVPFALTLNFHPTTKDLKLDNTKNLIDTTYINYLVSKSNYYRNSVATSSSQWKYQEANLINDNDINTSWMSHRVHWHYNSYDQIIIDLKSLKNIAAVKLSLGPTDKAPTKYSYSCSKDGKNWTLINTYYNNPRNHGEEKIDKFEPIDCLQLKMELFDTPKKDAPIITELEAIESAYSNIDFKKVKSLERQPFQYLNGENYSALIGYFESIGFPLEICLITDKNVNPGHCKKIAVKLNASKTYTIKFDPQGTNLKQIIINHPQQLDLKITKPTIKYLNLGETSL